MVERNGTQSSLDLCAEFIPKDDRLVRRISVFGDVVETSVPRGSRTDDGASTEDEDHLETWWRAYFQGQRPDPVDGCRGVLRTVELFCGPGGLGLGFAQAAAEMGFEVEVQGIADIDSEAVEVYNNNTFVPVRSAKSVTDLIDLPVAGTREDATLAGAPAFLSDEWAGLAGEVDVVLAGPPCQGHSNLNNHSRRTDARNELYLYVPVMAIALGAPLVIIENVPAVIHDDRGVVETTRYLLESAKYEVDACVIDASELGWPQRRRRHFQVARYKGQPIPLESVRDALREPPRPVSWAFSDLPRDRPDFMFETPELSAENRDRIDWLFENGKYDLPNYKRPDCHKDGTTYNSVYGRMKPDEPAQTVTTGFFTPGRGRYIHPTEKRVINAAEAARLQGFPDSYDFRPVADETPARGQLAKWIGDAVPMPLGYAAALSVLGPGLPLQRPDIPMER